MRPLLNEVIQEYTQRSMYFGHKLHIDQNEKLIHFGVTYVMAQDGFSGKTVSSSSAAVIAMQKNSVIYDEVYQAAVLEFGLWYSDQVRVDHGQEF